MQFDAQCLACLVRNQAQLAETRQEPEKAYRYLREVLRLILDAPEGVAAPYLIPQFNEAFARYWPDNDPYAAQKAASNRDMLSLLPRMRRMVEEADDPLLMALKMAQTGNYIDYAVLTENVSLDELRKKVEKAPENAVDLSEYANFREELAKARHMLYLLDNAGEIVADLVLVERLRAQFPELTVTCAVRGRAVLNDATREDAAAVGLDQAAEIVDNGSGIPGTELSLVGEEMRRALDEADLILSKGQGNFETLCGCGRNIYYIFLCKCRRFTKMFGVPPMTGMFCNERRLRIRSPFC